ncbi:hypothetical protein Aeqsu_2993 [Aequorivita sublithincola DSM 14238]|uniref:DUF4252 domain-containing protein n=1 Tax=Aequorivita sublithincola (strain DSM 14238 / LMG 21431 / ACAM 643 / 9-3) TaxID=746697 RepID=I3YZL4_AEQSU|nr:DUF4252 domain-containing protein [Aequorivita sublithincola]AFL82432.1 hypothetical protein Aeqsu_2993 [Aequorivita sublithincola DSM 14238]
MGFAKYFLTFLLGLVALSSCSDTSLQKYLVEKQDDDKFVKMDIAASLLQGKNSNFTQEEKDILSTIKKVNVVAYPIKENDTADFEKERNELKSILDQDQYKELTRIKSNDWNATLKYTGEEDAIDEVIVFASDNNRGFAVFRLLGKNMRPDQMLKLMKSAENGDLDLSKLEGFGKIFKD